MQVLYSEYSVYLPCLNKAKFNGVWCDRWEATYSSKSGASAASHAKLHVQLTAQSGVTRLTGQIIQRERGSEGYGEREEGDGGSQAHLVLAVSLPAEQLGVLMCHLRLVSHDAG